MLPALLDRPLVAHPYVGAWIVLLATLPFGLQSYHEISRIGLTTWEPGWLMGSNYYVYHVAAEAAMAGEPFYGIEQPDTPDGLVYLYPPITVVAFYPFTVLEWTTGFAAMTALSVIASVAATALIVRYIESFDVRLGWIDGGLILAAFLLSTHAMGTIYYGNINLLLGFAFVVGFVGLLRHHDRLAGAAFGLAALFKVFPAIVGLWLLRDRRWSSIGAAIGVGLGGLILGVILFGPRTTIYYFTEVLAGRGGSTAFIGGYPVGATYYVTFQRPLSHLLWSVWPAAPYEVLPVLSILLSLGVLAWFYRDIDGTMDRLMALFATVVVTVAMFPSFRFYIVLLYLPFIALLYVWRTGPGRYAFLLGGVLLSVTHRPSDIVALLEGTPDPVFFVGSQLAAFATLQLYGMAIMLLACAWYQYTTPPEDRTVDRAPMPVPDRTNGPDEGVG